MVIWIYICIYLPICIHVKMYRTILQEVKITVILENNFKNKDINISKLTYKRDTENAVLVSYGYCNKLPQIGWLKTTEIYCLIVLEERSLKSRVMLHLKLVKKSFLPLPSFWWFARSLWHSLTYNCITPVFLSHGILPMCLYFHMTILEGQQSYWVRGLPCSSMTSV